MKFGILKEGTPGPYPVEPPAPAGDEAAFWAELDAWPEPGLVEGPRVAGREAAFEALRAWRADHEAEGNATIEVSTVARSIAGARLVQSSGSPELDALALAIYASPPAPATSASDRKYLVTVYGARASATPDSID